MPLIPSLADIRGFASSINPLNMLADQDSAVNSPTTSSPSTATVTPSSPNAGPGPSTMFNSLASRSSTTSGTPLKMPGNIHPSRSPVTRRHTNLSNAEDVEDESDEFGAIRTTDGGEAVPQPKNRSLGALAKDRPMSLASGLTALSGDVKGGQRKQKLDTYVIVKPPPTTSKNPLNLQIQLIIKEPRRGRPRADTRSTSISDNSASLLSPPSSSDYPASEQASPPKPADLPHRSGSRSGSESPPNSGGLKRSGSLKSTTSSATSAGTTSTSGGMRKRVEPMFNLNVHNVMHPTTVTDASTDAKVAKFLKRTIDVMDVGVLEPAEIWLPGSSVSGLHLQPTQSGSDESGRRSRPVSVASYGASLSPTMTRSDDGRTSGASFDVKRAASGSAFLEGILKPRADGTEGNTKKFFGKIFNKKQRHESISSVNTMVRRDKSPAPSELSVEQTLNGNSSPHVTIKEPNALAVPAPGAGTGSALGQPTFGTSPLVVRRRSSALLLGCDPSNSSSITSLTAPNVNGTSISSAAAVEGTSPPKSVSALADKLAAKPIGYTWTVRRWARKTQEGWAAQLVAAASSGMEVLQNGSALGDDEVVFEWVKHRSAGAAGLVPPPAELSKKPAGGSASLAPPSKDGTRSRPVSTSSLGLDLRPDTSSANGSGSSMNAPKRAPSPLGHGPASSPMLDGRPDAVRRISGSAPSPSNVHRLSATSSPASTALSALPSDGDTSSLLAPTIEDDSDSEDSETPWSCYVLVRKTGHRQLLATLTPALHHPKVIATLKMAIRLEPICLAEVHPRVGHQSVSSRLSAAAAGAEAAKQVEVAEQVKKEVALTQENLKDVVCVTSMWLVAREEFGGLGRKKKL